MGSKEKIAKGRVKTGAKDEKVKKSLKYSVLDGSFYSVMSGFGERYISPFAIKVLNATNAQIGLLASLPQLISSVIQLASINVTNKLKNRKKVIVTSAFLQALMWLPILIIPFVVKKFSIYYFILFVTLYYLFGAFASPAWSSLMGDIVPEKERGKYFGRRNRITGLVAFLSVFGGGIVLSRISDIDIFLAFTILFIIALIARLISAYFLSRMHEPKYVIKEEEAYFSIWDFIKGMQTRNFSKFVLWRCLTAFTVSIAGPFFVVYMLRDLKLDFMTFTIILAASSISSFLAMAYWGKYIDRYGNKKIFTIAGFLVPIIPLLWLISKNAYFIVVIELFSGFVWAALDLSTSNFTLDAVTPQKRTRVVSYFNLLMGISIFLGAILGGFLATKITTPWIFFSNLQVIFLISAVCRLAVSIYFLPQIKEVRPVAPIGQRTLFVRLVAVEPMKGVVTETVSGMKKGIRTLDHGKKFLIEEIDELGRKNVKWRKKLKKGLIKK